MPRSIWNGAIVFGTVTVPVKVFAATERHTVHFREVHAKDGAQIEHRKVSSKSGREVKDIVKGYETSAGRYIVLEPDEIKALQAPSRKAIDIEHFVDVDEIDPVYYDRAYYLGVQKEGADAYAVLAAALEKKNRAGIGRVNLRGRELLVAVRVANGVLHMQTLRYADEVIPASDLDIDKPSKAPAQREVTMARKLVEGLVTEFDPGDYEDTHRDRLVEYLEARAAGKNPEPPDPEEDKAASGDLMAALEASLAGAKS